MYRDSLRNSQRGRLLRNASGKQTGNQERLPLGRNQCPGRIHPNLGKLPEGTSLFEDGRSSAFDVMIFFTRSRAELVQRFSSLARRLCPAGGLWIAWPKKASGVTTDLTEDRVREVGLEAGLVDNKVCAVDETWSGLRFVYRLKDRPAAKGKSPE
jgi:hypothetical protein